MANVNQAATVQAKGLDPDPNGIASQTKSDRWRDSVRDLALDLSIPETDLLAQMEYDLQHPNGKSSESILISWQTFLQLRARISTLITNMLQMFHETLMSAIRNIRA